jgi:cation transport regulator
MLLLMKESDMPYKDNSDLPESVKDNLPQHAQDIYREAYNSGWEQYKDPDKRRGDSSREETAHKIAWSAVKNEYEKDDKNGKWKRKKD